MTPPTPAIVAQSAVRRLPRLALWLFCLAYLIPGFVGREPWKNADMAAYGYMAELANGTSRWLDPTLLGLRPEFEALLPYWLGAWAIQIAPANWAPDFAARVPFAMLLALTLLATWYGAFHLARGSTAQPVAFAFGGEAQPVDYARAMADAALLALIACLGLAQLSHEVTAASAALAFTALGFYGLAASAERPMRGRVATILGLTGLALSGAPAIATLLAFGGCVLALAEAPKDTSHAGQHRRQAGWLLLLCGLLIVLGSTLNLFQWRLTWPASADRDWRSLGRLLLWFTWPAWPLALWTLWRWRHQLRDRHLALPVMLATVALATTLTTTNGERSLMLALPALAALAAFALPTFQRSVAALIDWFTLLFFSGCALVVWVIWIAMQTGFPEKPAANVARLAPGFEPTFSGLAFAAALAATLCWAGLVRWRVGRHRAAIWKSLVLPAAGAALCWLLLMTLWLPLLDHARSYTRMVRQVTVHLLPTDCVEVQGVSRGHIAALRFHGHLDLRAPSNPPACRWLVADMATVGDLKLEVDLNHWRLHAPVGKPTEVNDFMLVYTRIQP